MQDIRTKTDQLLQLMAANLPALARSLAGGEDEVDGSDLANYFLLGVAMVLENDPELKTPEQIERAAQEAASCIPVFVRQFRAYREQSGAGFLPSMMNGPRAV